jgi:competence protein ComEA
MQVRTTLLALTVALPICFAGSACTNNQSQSPDQIRQQTAAATAQLKDGTRAVAQGIKDGLNRPSADKPVDLNTASKAQLVSLPGMDDASADRVIAGRPYSSEHELLDKHILSREQYNKIADSITVKK